MRLRQTLDAEILSNPRRVQIGEVDHEIDWASLHRAPCVAWDPPVLRACERIYRDHVIPKSGEVIARRLFADLPVWVFLEYAAAFGRALLHGSNRADKGHLEPVQLSNNLIGWDKPRHFAFDSAVEAMFDAVRDDAMLKSLDCTRRCGANSVLEENGVLVKRLYFGLDYRALPFGPWRTGTVYLLDASDFPPDYVERPFLSDSPIRPMARVQVTPLDWPMLNKVQGIDLVEVNLRNRETYRGYPWGEEKEVNPLIRFREEAETSRRRLEAHLDEPSRLNRLGAQVSMSPFQLLRMFRAQFGVSPHAYQMRLRIDRAKQLLQTGKAIAEIAVDIGFADQSHLTHHFRREVGLTPGQYLRAQESSIRQS